MTLCKRYDRLTNQEIRRYEAAHDTIAIASQENHEESNGSDTLLLQIKVPAKVLNWLTKVAKFRQSSSIESLARSYVGEGLRADLDRLGIDRLLDETEQVLSEQLESEEEVKLIMKTIQARYQKWRIPRR